MLSAEMSPPKCFLRKFLFTKYLLVDGWHLHMIDGEILFALFFGSCLGGARSEWEAKVSGKVKVAAGAMLETNNDDTFLQTLQTTSELSCQQR